MKKLNGEVIIVLILQVNVLYYYNIIIIIRLLSPDIPTEYAAGYLYLIRILYVKNNVILKKIIGQIYVTLVFTSYLRDKTVFVRF